MTQRYFMQRLRTDAWRRLAAVSTGATEGFLKSLISNGWIERQGMAPDQEVRLTPSGLEALRAPVRTY
jgi:DNA-binding PadR family transcriptional regulator